MNLPFKISLLLLINHLLTTFAQSTPLLHSLSCNFEYSFCGWSDFNGASWMRTNSSTIDPGHDTTCSIYTHTGNDICGNWLTTIPSSNYTGTQDFILINTVPLSTFTPHGSSISFSYHFFGLEDAQISLQQNSQKNTFNSVDLWTKRSPQSNGWKTACVNIDASKGRYVMFHATLNAKYHDTVGLDDIYWSNSPCEFTKDCDLEANTCSWATNGIVRTKPSPITPISTDHTTGTSRGHYLLGQSSGKLNAITASLGSLMHFYNNMYSSCFKFWYYIESDPKDGGPVDTASYIEAKLIAPYNFSKTLSIVDATADGLLNAWQPFFLPIERTSQLGPQYNITVTLFTSGEQTQIALDDLQLDGTACPKMGYCDFEQDFCGWANTRPNLWLRNSGGSSTGLKQSPRTDTTTKSGSGWYAVVPAEYSSRSFLYANLRSPPLSTVRTSICFSLNYFAVAPTPGTAVLNVAIEDLTNAGNILQTFTLNASTSSNWNSFHTTIHKMPPRYSISISTPFHLPNLKSDIAIDDLSLNDAKCSGDQPISTSTTPVPISERKWNCNFDAPCPEWSFDSTWKLTSYRQVSSDINAPRADHTVNLPEGRYLLWWPSAVSNTSTAEVYSTVTSSVYSPRAHCFSFWYFDGSEIEFELSISIAPKSKPKSTTRLRTVRSTISTRSWKFVQLDLPTFSAQNIIILKFNATAQLKGSFALDDIKLNPGSCSHTDDYIYTFDSYDNLEISQIMPISRLIAQIYNPTTDPALYPHAPHTDHTTGDGSYLLFMNRPTDLKTNYEDHLVLNYLKPTFTTTVHARCVRFAFRIYGNASLAVFINLPDSNALTAPIFKSMAYHTDWVMTQFTYLLPYEHKMVFTMTKPFDEGSYVALDDLSLHTGHCNTSPVDCDFDDDTCEYSSMLGKSDYQWARMVAPPNSFNWPGPIFDHSTRSFGGGYLYMTGFPSEYDGTRIALLQTPLKFFWYTGVQNQCLSFWSQLTAPDAILILEIELYTLGASRIPRLLTLTNQTETKWTHHYVNITRDLFKGASEYNLLIQGRTRKASTLIALDDIELYDGLCTSTFKCTNGHQVSIDAVCNFKNDCTDGSDEAGCGETCDFEHDSNNCDWFTPSPRVAGSWQRKTAGASGYGPKVDGSGTTTGHYMQLIAPTGLVSGRVGPVKLSRNYDYHMRQLKDSYYTCALTFDYYLNSTNSIYPTAALEVHIGITTDSAPLKFYTRNSSPKWQTTTVQIDSFIGPFVVFFVGTLYAPNETLAIDNLHFSNCSIPDPLPPSATCGKGQVLCNSTRICIEQSDLCDWEDNCGDLSDESYQLCRKPGSVPMCGFEKTLEDCGVSVQSKWKYFNWALVRGFDSNYKFYYSGTSAFCSWSSDIGCKCCERFYSVLHTANVLKQQKAEVPLYSPAADHTTKDYSGQYLTLSSYGQFMGNHSYLYTPMLTSNSDCHFRFFYWNDGNSSSSAPKNILRVYAQYADGNREDSGYLFTSDSYQSRWIKGKVTYNSKEPFRFVLDGLVNDFRGSISLDDLSYSPSCLPSNAKRTPGSGGKKSPLLAIFLVLLALGLLSGTAFFLYKMHQSGRLNLNRFTNTRNALIQSRVNEQVAYVNEGDVK